MGDWFATARFGMFVHWGHSSQQGIELSWPLVGGVFNLPSSNVGVDAYHASAATFDPRSFDAKALACAAKQAGMTYAVMTAKHHDGYAMFDTKLSDFSAMHSPCGRDLVREFLDAMRAEGLRAGVYFSLIDWHHPDFPAFTEADKPYVFGRWRQPSEEQWERFREFMSGQVRELLTDYGPIDLIWFDGGWERRADQWRSAELEAMIRTLQPGILINDRLPGARADFMTPEQFVPPSAPGSAWETCLTMNESWGYNPADTAYKSARQLVHTLCEVAAKGGNLLLNVSPRGDGTLPPEQTERLQAMAGWMARNGEAITGSEPGLEPWQFYGPSTRKGGRVYLHLLLRPYETVTVRGVYIRRVRSVTHLATGEALTCTTRCSILDQFLNSDPQGEVTIELPERLIDPLATVVAVDLAEGPLAR